MIDLDKLMQLGDYHWTELAACRDDPRFTQADPPNDAEAKQLSDICRSCDVFFECLDFHDEWDAVAVFAHGEWRYERAVPDSDTVSPATDECQRPEKVALPPASES